MTIEAQLQEHSVNNIVELFEVDLTPIGGVDVLRFSAHIETATLWKGNTYQPLPLEVSNVNRSMEGAPPRLKFRVSNINRALMSEVITLGDMVGAEVTRWKTLAMFLDGEPTADPNQHWPVETYTVIQMEELSRDTITFTVGTELDRPTRKIPRRQVLREDVNGALHAPLAGLYGLNRR